MIGTVTKPMAEIYHYLQGEKKVIVVGCDGCARISHTGGEPEVNSMADKLEEKGFNVIARVLPERTCYIHKTKKAFAPYDNEIKEADSFLVLGCGGAVQVVRQVTEEKGIYKPIHPGLNSIGHMDTIIEDTLFLEQCQECGECILEETGGICPVTKCAKGLLNGPCGGAENGKCEVDRNRDCAWILIYERLKRLGQLDRLKSYKPPKNYSKMSKPRMLQLNL